MNGLQYHRRGRASRRRNKRTLWTRLNNLSSDPSAIVLVQWMCSQGWNPTCKLRLASNVVTGRGLQAINGVKAGDMLVSIPEKLLITANTVCKRFRIENLDVPLSEHGLLAVFIFVEARLGSDSPWYPYFQTLPKKFAVPSYCSDSEILSLPSFMRSRVLEQKNAIEMAFARGCQFIAALISNGRLTKSTPIPTLSEFQFAWLVVNTRAVYMSCATDFMSCKIVRDCNGSNLALAPYLDMFNHSCNARADAGFNKSSRCYEIRSQIDYPAKEQVFINYGPHDSLKLWIEYGFYLPNNPHDAVTFLWDDILAYSKNISHTAIITSRKIEFLRGHSLTENLCCSLEGFSWSLSALICVVCIEDSEKSTYQRVFHGDWIPFESLSEILFALEIVCRKKMEFIEARKAMIDVEGSDSCQMAIGILEEYINILMKAEDRFNELHLKKTS